MRIAIIVRTLVLMSALLLLSSASAVQAQELQTITHQSKALGREVTYGAIVPSDAANDKRYPVLYILHGAYGDWRDWPDKSSVKELAKNYKMILIFPDGGKFGWYLNSPIDPAFQYESYITGDLISDVDARFPTINAREGRSIMGLSMGGHGAMSMAAKYPHMFTSASSLSGILRLENHPEHWELSKRLGEFKDNAAAWKANSTYELAGVYTTASLRLMFDCGVDDTKTGAFQDNVDLHERLKELKVPHIWRAHAGTHSWDYWNKHLQSHLNFHQAAVIDTVPTEEKWFPFYHRRMRGFLDENAKLVVEPPTLPTMAMLGSSSPQGMSADLFPGWHYFNRGISADRLGIGTRGVSHRLEESVFDMKPQVVVFKIGRNDLSAAQSNNGDPSLDRIIEEYELIVSTIRQRLPDSTLLVTSSLPVRGNYERLKEPVEVYNERLKVLAAKHGAIYSDAHSLLKGEDGLLKPEYSADGLHLSRAGKEVWADLILKTVQPAK